MGDLDASRVRALLTGADCSEAEAGAIHRLTSLCRVADRFVLPPPVREAAIEQLQSPLVHKQSTGFGFLTPAKDKP